MPYTTTTLADNPNGQGITTSSTFRLTGLGRARLKTVNSEDLPVNLEFPFGPKELKIDNIAANVSEIRRPGRKPLLFVESPSLMTISFSATIADKLSGGRDPAYVLDFIDSLGYIASEGLDCKFVYGLWTGSETFKITQLTINENVRNADGMPIRCIVDIQLTESYNYYPEIYWLDVITFEPEIEPIVQAAQPPPDPVDPSLIYTSQFGTITPAEANQLLSFYSGTSGREYTTADLNTILYGIAF